MPKRTIKGVFYLEKDGTEHPHGAVVDLSDAEAKRGDAISAFFESPAPKPADDPLNENRPNEQSQGPPKAAAPRKTATKKAEE